MEKISLAGMFSLELIKKSSFSGSFHGMRYMLQMEDGKMRASVYPEPYCWDATPEDQKVSEYFEHTQEGIGLMTEWLNLQYHEKFQKDSES